jgi:hypothetical protein
VDLYILGLLIRRINSRDLSACILAQVVDGFVNADADADAASDGLAAVVAIVVAAAAKLLDGIEVDDRGFRITQARLFPQPPPGGDFIKRFKAGIYGKITLNGQMQVCNNDLQWLALLLKKA